MAAGLHAIESNNFVSVANTQSKDFDRPNYSGAMSKHWAIPPAQDPVDLAERIGTLYVPKARKETSNHTDSFKSSQLASLVPRSGGFHRYALASRI